jgi:polyhydroxyalkanoate synthesis regulator protein
VNTQITNIAAMQLQIEMFAKQIKQEMEMLQKEVLQSFTTSAKAEKIAKGILEKKNKEVQKAILAKNIE